MKFKQFLNEDEGGGAVDSGEGSTTVNDSGSVGSTLYGAGGYTNLSSNIAKYDKPLGLKKRIDMPQIDSKLFVEFIADLENRNIGCQYGKQRCEDLLPTQDEFNDDKVNNIKNDIKNGNLDYHPILITKHNEIVDGHHRWKAFEPSDSIKTFKVDMGFDDLHDFLINKPYTFRKTIKE